MTVQEWLVSFTIALVVPGGAEAQTQRLIGYLDTTSATAAERFVSIFRSGLNQSGFVPDRDVTIEHQWAHGKFDELPALVTAIIQKKPAVLVAATLPAAQAAKAGAAHLPVVFAISADPVEFGLVQAFNRPGGNITGVTQRLGELGGKRLELLHDAFPNAKKVGVLANPNNPHGGHHTHSIESAGAKLGVSIRVFPVTHEHELEKAFYGMRQQGVEALIVADDPIFRLAKDKVIAFCAKHAIPTVHFGREFTSAGGLMSYGPNMGEVYQRFGAITAKVLKGERAGEIPVEEPNVFELVINQKAANASRLTIQPTILARSNEVVD